MVVNRFVRKYYEQLYTKTLYNPEEMFKFFENYKLPKLTQEEISQKNYKK